VDFLSKIQMYKELKEVRILARLTTLGTDRYVITIPKEDKDTIKGLKGKRVFITVREAVNE
jgi:hypothetical protein